jgi:DNA ligase D-like protein (predicted ligase)
MLKKNNQPGDMMHTIFNNLSENARGKLKKTGQPDWTGPMLATLSKEHFSKEGWIFERKFDGERCLVFKNGGNVRLISRNKKEKNHQYPEIAEAFNDQKHDFVVDGEIVAFDGNVTSFSKLQPRMHSKKPDRNIKVYCYVFDIIYLEGTDLSAIELTERKKLLKKALSFNHDHLRYTIHRNKEGEKYLEEACGKGWEGLIAKDAGSGYIHKRSKKWLKFKCQNRQELVICGYTAPQGEREHFGALIVGFYKEGNLKHAGKVGTGYDEATLERVHEKMKPLEQQDNPFKGEVPDYQDVTWLKPDLVGEFRFTEWTDKNRLRHPAFLGLRDDKKAKDVRKEVPE